MLLACMVARDENALICDFAETYHIYDWRSLPARYAAVLAAGLKNDSRIKMSLSGSKFTFEQLLSCIISDAVRLLVWQNTRDGVNGENQPKSLLSMLIDQDTSSADNAPGFDSPDEFMAWRSNLIGGGGAG